MKNKEKKKKEIFCLLGLNSVGFYRLPDKKYTTAATSYYIFFCNNINNKSVVRI